MLPVQIMDAFFFGSIYPEYVALDLAPFRHGRAPLAQHKTANDSAFFQVALWLMLL